MGLHPAWYTLKSVDINFESNNTATDVEVEIWSSWRTNDGNVTGLGRPGAFLWRLINPISVTGGGVRTFVTADEIRLIGGYKYFVVVKQRGSNPPNLEYTTSTGLDDGRQDEFWDLGNRAYRRNSGSGDWETLNNVMAIAIKGDARTYSTETRLNSLEIRDNFGHLLALNRDFDRNTRRDYTVRVPHGIGAVTLMPTPRNADADAIYFLDYKRRGLGAWRNYPPYKGKEGRARHRVELGPGSKTIIMEVRAEDGKAYSEYSVWFTRAPRPPDPCIAGDLCCATLTVGTAEANRGFSLSLGGYGQLSPREFTANGVEVFVILLSYADSEPLVFSFETDDDNLPPDGLLGSDDLTLYLGTKAFQIDNLGPSLTEVRFPNHGLSWSDGQRVLVRLVRNGGAMAPPEAPAPAPLTASLHSAPDSHDGEEAFRVRIAFSDSLRNSYRTLDQGFAVSGGAITGVRRAEGKGVWQFTVTPSGDADVTLTLAGGRACSVTGVPCTKDGRRLSETLTVTVPGPEDAVAPLTARIHDFPAEHEGEGNRFEVRIAFSEPIANSYRRVHEAARAEGARIGGAVRVNGRSDLWDFRVWPEGDGPVTFRFAGGGTCGEDHPAVLCTSDGRALSNTVSIEVRGPAAISVADAEATEGEDETIDFVVSLDRAALRTITVDYATRDGSAKAGEDYTAKSGTLSFTVGQRSKTVRVALLDDVKDEDEETFTLVLSNATGARIEDGEATGTIENSDPLQQAWIARFGRTVASQAVDAIGDRLAGGGGTQVTVGGQGLSFDGAAPANAEAQLETLAEWLQGGEDERERSRGMTGSEVMLGSSFSFSAGGEDGTPSVTAWGRFATGSFDADVDGLSLSGDVTTGFLGADVAAGRWLGGLALSSSKGEGPFRMTGGDATTRGSGTVESTLTALYPYARLSATERLDVWAMAGFGRGGMTIAENGGTPLETDIGMTMGAVGARGTLLEPPPEGELALNLRSDALLVRMESDALRSAAGSLAAAEAEVSRVRLILEGSRAFAVGADGSTLTPGFEVGLRNDGGDAETGTGIEVGGRLSYTRPGVTVEGAVRSLVAHDAGGYEEWGASGSVRIDPGESGRGLSLTLSPTWGNAGSGTEQLWSLADADGLAQDGDFETGRRLEAEARYGFWLGHSSGVATPYAGLGLSDEGERTVRLGTRWSMGPDLALGFEGTRSERDAGEAPDHTLAVRGSIRW